MNSPKSLKQADFPEPKEFNKIITKVFMKMQKINSKVEELNIIKKKQKKTITRYIVYILKSHHQS